MTTIVVYDTEFTSWDGSQGEWWDSPGQYREVTQIRAVRYDMTEGKVVDRFNHLVRPIINPQLSNYHLALTGHRQIDIDRAEPLAAVFPKFVDWVEGHVAMAYGWDALVLMETALLQGIECSGTVDGILIWLDLCKRDGSWPPSIDPLYRHQPAGVVAAKRNGPHRTREKDISNDPDTRMDIRLDGQLLRTANLKPWFRARGVPVDQYRSGELHQYMGLSLDGHVHDALFDATSLAMSYQAMMKRA